MKRSKIVKLVAMGSAAVAAAGCDQPQPVDSDIQAISPEMSTYASVDDCIAKAIFTEKYCRDQLALAQKVHSENAPRFNSKDECAAQYGEEACQIQYVAPAQTEGAEAGSAPATTAPENSASNGGGSFWMPAMAGFMLGQALGGRGGEYNYYNSPRPVYKNPSVYNAYKNPAYRPYYQREKDNSYSGGGYSGGSYSSGSYSSGSYSNKSYSNGSNYNRNTYSSSNSYSTNKGLNSYKPAQSRTEVVARSGFGSRSSGFSFGG